MALVRGLFDGSDEGGDFSEYFADARGAYTDNPRAAERGSPVGLKDLQAEVHDGPTYKCVVPDDDDWVRNATLAAIDIAHSFHQSVTVRDADGRPVVTITIEYHG